jgi:hypothetical protein
MGMSRMGRFCRILFIILFFILLFILALGLLLHLGHFCCSSCSLVSFLPFPSLSLYTQIEEGGCLLCLLLLHLDVSFPFLSFPFFCIYRKAKRTRLSSCVFPSLLSCFPLLVSFTYQTFKSTNVSCALLSFCCSIYHRQPCQTHVFSLSLSSRLMSNQTASKCFLSFSLLLLFIYDRRMTYNVMWSRFHAHECFLVSLFLFAAYIRCTHHFHICCLLFVCFSFSFCYIHPSQSGHSAMEAARGVVPPAAHG